MTLVDPDLQRAEHQRQVEMYKEHIRQGGTPPFVSDRAWEQATQESNRNPLRSLIDLMGGSQPTRQPTSEGVMGEQVLGMMSGQQLPTMLVSGLLQLLRKKRK